MLEYEEALARILAAIPVAQSERVSLAAAHGRILAERILAPIDLPPFDNSAVDGYAVRAKEVQGATESSPKSLSLCGRTPAGETFAGAVEDGNCVRIFTGSPLPAGADAVVMQEDTKTDPAAPDTVLVTDAVRPWENVRFRGEDVKSGVVVAEPGRALGPARLGLLGALGLTEVAVGRKPKVSLLATGSELIEGGKLLSPAGIYESNRASLAALVSDAGGVPKVFPLVRDTAKETQQALSAAFADADLVVTSGGVSVGEMDFVKSAFSDLGGQLEFWKVAIRPGRPFVFGQLNGKFLFGLPGNPVSAFVSFLLLARPALLRWQGAVETGLSRQTGTLSEAVSNDGGRRHFMRVRMDANGVVHPTGAQASHILSSLAAANALMDVPPNTTFAAGALVQVLRWE